MLASFLKLSVFANITILSQGLVSPIYETIRNANVIDAKTGSSCSPIQSSSSGNKKSLVIVLPQLGEFDSYEFCEQLAAVEPNLKEANIDLRVIGIGDATKCAPRFCEFTGLSIDTLTVDPDATLHRELGLKSGPLKELPDWISDDNLSFFLKTVPGGVPSDPSLLRPTGKAWLNYFALCAGISAPGTLKEVLRGYFGDFSAPERLKPNEVVKAGFIEIGPGVGPVKIGPLKYNQWFSDERGYQRPVELATIRLKSMVEVLTKWDTYVSNPTLIDQRGATFLFSETGDLLYEYRHKGVLTYSETMPRPLTFLSPYIGKEKALNPLGLLDYDDASKTNPKGRGILKPAGRFMTLLKPVFYLETKLQTKLSGVTESDMKSAKQHIEDAIQSNHVVIYTYGLSPFSSQATQVLQDAGCENYKVVEVGPEWFLLDVNGNSLRQELLDMTGQSSLPHIFIGGRHVGGLFSGVSDDAPGIAALQESGKLVDMLKIPRDVEAVDYV